MCFVICIYYICICPFLNESSKMMLTAFKSIFFTHKSRSLSLGPITAHYIEINWYSTKAIKRIYSGPDVDIFSKMEEQWLLALNEVCIK